MADDWLKSFNDPALDAIVAEAIANNLDLRQAAAVVEIARQTVVVVGSKLWPQIGVQFGSATLHDASESANTNSNMQYGGNLLGDRPLGPAARAAGRFGSERFKRQRSITRSPASRSRRQRRRAGIWRSKPASSWRSRSRPSRFIRGSSNS